ncbi:hypothetical protein KP509_01G051800 [Ceratopteris richardii]|uniref:Golgin-84 n=1 Tax=Ceratopteris richardii TaxID=49495 RepID=A0A8T2VCW5_CERRI|nr:hypothetical protein KP509_01G051800 [Ceratopteris richardii]
MASWFRAAEELFEVVDRRAKQVTDDLLIGAQSSGRVPANSSLTKGSGISGKEVVESSFLSKGSDANAGSLSSSTDAAISVNNDTDSLKALADEKLKSPVERSKLQETSLLDDTDNVGPANEDNRSGSEGCLSKEASDDQFNKHTEHVAAGKPVECKILSEDDRVSVQLIAKPLEGDQSDSVKHVDATAANSTEPSDKATDGITAYTAEQTSAIDTNAKDRPRLDEQLDEAQKLLKAAATSGQSKEARLARVCAGLSSRLQEYKTENGQLETLLLNQKEENSSLRAKIKDLQLEIASARADVIAVESEMSSAFASKNAEIESLLASLESFKKQAAQSEGKLAALQADMDAMSTSRDMTENGMIQTLKDALEIAENRAEEEHLAHVATRKAAAQREAELEQCVADVTASLSRMQRVVDERTQRAAELEQKLLAVELDCASLTQELQNAEAKLRKEQKRSLEDSIQTSQIQVWREDAERARQAQREMEGRNMALEAENQKLRVELSATKREADEYSNQAQKELEKRFRELTEVLYLKQTQLEEMASEKAAALIQLEKELRKSREAQAEAERSRRMRHSNLTGVWDDESDMKTFESLGLHQRQLVGSSIQKAAKFLDTAVVTAGRFLWRRPLARLGLLFYLVFVHAFLLFLMHRLQEQVVNSISSREELEAATAAGLVKLGMRQVNG